MCSDSYEDRVELEDRRVEPLHVADHEHAACGVGGVDQPLRVATSGAIGFSTRTSMPAAISSCASGAWNGVGVATTAASTRPASSSSRPRPGSEGVASRPGPFRSHVADGDQLDSGRPAATRHGCCP